MAYRFAVAKANPSEINPATLSIGLLALLEKVSRRAGKGDVHRLRTTVRRLEVQLGTTPPKIAKSLKKLRKNAGKVRDLDVHLGLLEQPLLPRRGRHASDSPEARCQEKLRSFLQKKLDRERIALRVRVKQSAPLLEARLPDLVQRLSGPGVTLQEARQRAGRARRRFLQWTASIPEDEQRLHRLRIRTKKERYLLEPLRNCQQAVEVAERFKQVQDAVGQWHDWATLAELAERCFNSSQDSSKGPSGAASVLHALHARVGREYRRARRSAESARRWMSGSRMTGSRPGKASATAAGARGNPSLPARGTRARPSVSAGTGPRLVGRAG